MQKRRKVVVLTIAGLLIFLAVVFVATRTPHLANQPVYKGLSLAQWLDVVDRHRVNGYFTAYQEGRPPSRNATPQEIHEAEEAVRAIGTNALPHLLVWINPKPSALKRFYGGILNLLPLPDHTRGFLWGLPGRREETLAQFAVQGFRVLNTNAIPALADLSNLANDTNRPWTQTLAGKALTEITTPPP